jgi:hypothetical protein
MQNPLGYVLYKGKSLINGDPIVVIATMSSNNPKTGNEIQTWILPDNGIKPNENVKTGADASVCGDCPKRPLLTKARNLANGTKDKPCYLRTFQAPRSVYDAFKRGRYSDQWNSKTFFGRMIRLGSYGDPAAVPFEVWEKVLKRTIGHTGYTHQWQSKTFDPRLSRYVMASVDNVKEAAIAIKKEYRYFRVKDISESKIKKEANCPASKESGQLLTCSTCRACSGSNGRKGNIVINQH